ncbi:MAG: hypothetical protein JWO53_988, partial [Chlamydiia bacterium]|nr:hypothetical protein [Chlamydiia bacterium]
VLPKLSSSSSSSASLSPTSSTDLRTKKAFTFVLDTVNSPWSSSSPSGLGVRKREKSIGRTLDVPGQEEEEFPEIPRAQKPSTGMNIRPVSKRNIEIPETGLLMDMSGLIAVLNDLRIQEITTGTFSINEVGEEREEKQFMDNSTPLQQEAVVKCIEAAFSYQGISQEKLSKLYQKQQLVVRTIATATLSPTILNSIYNYFINGKSGNECDDINLIIKAESKLTKKELQCLNELCSLAIATLKKRPEITAWSIDRKERLEKELNSLQEDQLEKIEELNKTKAKEGLTHENIGKLRSQQGDLQNTIRDLQTEIEALRNAIAYMSSMFNTLQENAFYRFIAKDIIFQKSYQFCVRLVKAISDLTLIYPSPIQEITTSITQEVSAEYFSHQPVLQALYADIKKLSLTELVEFQRLLGKCLNTAEISPTIFTKNFTIVKKVIQVLQALHLPESICDNLNEYFNFYTLLEGEQENCYLESVKSFVELQLVSKLSRSK